MKKTMSKMLVGVGFSCVLLVGFFYANGDVGVTSNRLEEDIRSSQNIKEDWIVEGYVSDNMAAFIAYPQDRADHNFSIYVKRPELSFGYFFRGGGDIVQAEKYIAEFTVEGYNERAFISTNTQSVDRVEIDVGNSVRVIDIDNNKPFAIVLPDNVGEICFYDVNGNVVEYRNHLL